MTDIAQILDNRKGKRYVVTIDLYMFAESDEQIIKDAGELAGLIAGVNDNSCEVVEIVQREFGEVDYRTVI